MIGIQEDNILDKKKEHLNMDKDVTNFLEMVAIIKGNGGIIKWMERGNHILDKDSCNILVNGRLINIMDGVYCILILILM